MHQKSRPDTSGTPRLENSSGTNTELAQMFNDSKAVQEWMVTKLSNTLGVPARDIDIELPFTSFGLDSINAFNLTGDLAEWLGHSLPPTLLWDYPTVQSLADHLGKKLVFSDSPPR